MTILDLFFQLDPANVLPADTPYLAALSIPAAAAADRIEAKYLQLDPPEGKVSDRRKAQLALRKSEKDTRRLRRQREADCGLVGKRRKVAKGKGKEVVSWFESLLPVHHLRLGYMAELLQLRIAPTPLPPPPAPSVDPPQSSTHSSATLLPTFVPRPKDLASTAVGTNKNKLNVPAIHMKLVKAEFVGAILTIKRAKYSSLVRLKALAMQETQSTFKIVTPKATVKILLKEGSISTLSLPLAPPPGSSPTAAARFLSLDIYGDAFAYRSADRVGEKWKAGSGAGGVELR